MSRAEKIRSVDCSSCGAREGEHCVGARGNLRELSHPARRRKYAQAQQFAEMESVRADGGPARDAHGRVLVLDRSESTLPFGGFCAAPGCDERLMTIESSVKTSRGWIHRACAPGARDGEVIA